MTMVVLPPSARRRPARTARSFAVSRCEVASSRISTGARLSRARAMARRWRWPPERATPRSPGHRLVAVREGQDEVVGAGPPGGRLHLGVGGLRVGQAEVLPDGGVEEVDVLGHQGEAGAQVVQAEVPQVAPVQGDPLPILGVPEAQRAGARRWSCRPPSGPRGPGSAPARRRRSRRAAPGLSPAVAEGDALEAYRRGPAPSAGGTPCPSETTGTSSCMAKTRRPEPKALASCLATRAMSATGPKQVKASMVAMGSRAAVRLPWVTM